jgi:probable HAF family extracellular repeat protein
VPGNPNAFSKATDVSNHGQVVVGFSDLNNLITQHAFRWTAAGGIVDLGSGNGASGFSRAFGVSGDGTKIVGDSDFPGGQRNAFLWTQAGGFQNLGSLGNVNLSVASAITSDGSVVVGQSSTTGINSAAFRWTQATGMVNLGTLAGDNNAAATAVSDNGKIVVGISAPRPLAVGNLGWDFGTDTHAFRWTQATGMKSLGALLAAAGVNVTGINLVAATGISPNGQ